MNKTQVKSVSVAGVLLASLATLPVQALNITVAPGGNIQSAIDQVNAAGGGSVFLQAGTYTISAPLRMRSNVALDGAGSGATIIQNTGSSATYNLITENSDNLTDVTLRDFALNGRDSAAGNGIIFDDPLRGHLRFNLLNLEVRDVHEMGIHPKGHNGLVQANNYVHDSGQVSLLHNQYLRRTDNVNISGSRFQNSPLGDGCKLTIWVGATVTDSTFVGNRNRGFRTQDVNSNGNFRNNVALDNAWDGMEIVGSDTIIESNQAHRNGWDTASSFRYGIRTPGGSGEVRNNNASANGGPNYDIHGSFTFTGNTQNPLPAFSRIQTESFSSMAGVQVETCNDTGGGQHIGFIHNNDYAVYNGVKLTGVTGVDVRVASNTAGGSIEVRVGSTTGPLIGTVSVANTGGWQTWTTRSATINQGSGTQNIYLVFKGGSGYLFNVNWFQFK